MLGVSALQVLFYITKNIPLWNSSSTTLIKIIHLLECTQTMTRLIFCSFFGRSLTENLVKLNTLSYLNSVDEILCKLLKQCRVLISLWSWKTARQQQLVSNWILTSCSLHRVPSGWSVSAVSKYTYISKLLSSVNLFKSYTHFYIRQNIHMYTNIKQKLLKS